MGFSRFKISIIIQVLLIALTTLAFFWTINQEYMLITSSSLAIIWILQIVFLIRYLQKVNRDLIKFITAIKYDDVSISFNKDNKTDKSFEKLHNELNQIIQDISEVRSDKETEHQYFQNTIKHIGTGIIAFDKEGKIELCNNAALKILNLSKLEFINEIDKTQAGLSKKISKIRPGTTSLLKIIIDNEIVQLSIKAAHFKIKTREIKLLSLQNIKSEIDQSEVDAWQKLIRVLTHEIMNSVSPIKLLSGSLIEMFEENDKIKTIEEIDNTIIENSVLGLKTIRKRSAGLSNFVETYKNLTQIPKANFSEFKICHLFDHINTLLINDLEQKSIRFTYNSNPKDVVLYADEKLIEQVLINLIKNASEALVNINNPVIKLEAAIKNEKIQIKVTDNGAGIKQEVLDNIFIPFFTTKEKGSGIGLSLSRQIMHLHGGNITVKSNHVNLTEFTLHF